MTFHQLRLPDRKAGSGPGSSYGWVIKTMVDEAGAAAEEFIDYVYDPKNQAQIEAYVNYVSPVENVKPILLKEEPEVAKNQLIFPSKSFTKNCTIQPSPTGEEEQNLNREFNAVLNG